MPSCPECTAREKKKIQEKYEADTPEEERDSGYELVKELEGAVEELPEKKPEERSKGLMSRKSQDGI